MFTKFHPRVNARGRGTAPVGTDPTGAAPVVLAGDAAADQTAWPNTAIFFFWSTGLPEQEYGVAFL